MQFGHGVIIFVYIPKTKIETHTIAVYQQHLIKKLLQGVGYYKNLLTMDIFIKYLEFDFNLLICIFLMSNGFKLCKGDYVHLLKWPQMVLLLWIVQDYGQIKVILMSYHINAIKFVYLYYFLQYIMIQIENMSFILLILHRFFTILIMVIQIGNMSLMSLLVLHESYKKCTSCPPSTTNR